MQQFKKYLGKNQDVFGPFMMWWHLFHQYASGAHRVLPCVAVCCRVLQCVALCCTVLQCRGICSTSMSLVHRVMQ